MKRLIWLFLIGMAFAQADGPGGATNGTVPNKCGRGTNPCTVANALNVTGLSTLAGGITAAAGTQYFHDPVNGDGTTNSASGTSNGLLAKTINTGGVLQAQTCATTDTAQACFPVVKQRVGTSPPVYNGCTSACTTGNAYIQSTPGATAACTFDNTSVVDHYVVASTSVAGQCHDTGSATAPTSNWIVGRAKTAGTGSQSVSIESQVAGGAGSAPTVNAYFSQSLGNTALVAQGTNNTRIWGFTMYAGITASSGMCYMVSTADNTADLYDIGVYDSTGTLKAHVGATAGTTFAPSTGSKCLSWTGGTVDLAAGKYYVAVTGNANTLVLGGTTGATTGANFAASVNPTGGTTAGGALNGSITAPADSWAAGSFLDFQIHN